MKKDRGGAYLLLHDVVWIEHMFGVLICVDGLVGSTQRFPGTLDLLVIQTLIQLLNYRVIR